MCSKPSSAQVDDHRHTQKYHNTLCCFQWSMCYRKSFFKCFLDVDDESLQLEIASKVY